MSTLFPENGCFDTLNGIPKFMLTVLYLTASHPGLQLCYYHNDSKYELILWMQGESYQELILQ